MLTFLTNKRRTKVKFQSTKAVQDIKLSGVTIEAEFRNDVLSSITFTDSNGSVVKIAEGRYNGIDALVPAPPKMAKKYKLGGMLLGITQFEEMFDDEYEANNRLTEVSKQTGYADNLGLSVTEVEVEVSE
jgi:hypothetical protein